MKLPLPVSLTQRLVLVAAATVVPIAALTIYGYWETRSDRRESEMEAAVAYGQGLATTIDTAARGIESLALASALSLGTGGELDQESKGEFLVRVGEAEERLRAVFVLDLEGTVVVTSNPDSGTGLNLRDRSYFVALDSGRETVWTGGLTGLESGEVTVAHGRTIRDSEGTAVGYLICAFYPVTLGNELPEGAPSDSHIFMLDQDGQLIFSTNPGLGRGETEPRTDSQLIRDALGGATVTLDGDTTPLDEGERFGVIVGMERLGWVVGFTRSQAALEEALVEDLARDLAILALIAGLSIGGLYLATRPIIRPIRTLTTAAAAIGGGSPAELGPPPGDPEVAQLHGAFSQMLTAVRTRESALREQTLVLEALDRAAADLARSLDVDGAVRAVTDAGTRLTGAAFGAFFYNVTGPDGESYQLYTISGVPREAFANFPMPRKTDVFGPTFDGAGVIRSDDIQADARYGKTPPYYGMPTGHLPVRSYLAVPVAAPGGEVIGGLFFGHPEPARFSETEEQFAVGIANWAAIVLANARLYEESVRIRAELEEANKSKDEFLGVIAHELRTPMTVILGSVRLLADRGDRLDPADKAELTSSLVDESVRMATLIEDLLALTRAELTGTSSGAVTSIASEVAATVETLAVRSPGRVVRLSVPDFIPPVAAEPTYVRQVLANLLSNADKYSPPEGVIAVTVRALSEGMVEVAVEDEGPGVPEDECERIFESFFRSERTAEAAKGNGLGLAVCRRLAEVSGGTIHAENVDQGGLRVVLRLPVVREAAGTRSADGSGSDAGVSLIP